MGGGRNGKNENQSFADAMQHKGGVKPLDSPRRVAPTARPTTPRTRSKPAPAPRGEHFHRPQQGEPLLGHDASVRKRDLKQLRAGHIEPGISIDLHGRDRNSAREHLTARVAAARRQRVRCVVVIHGRGHHSVSGEAVLRSALPGWLDTPPLRDMVLAFAPAQSADGGSGATYLLLR